MITKLSHLGNWMMVLSTKIENMRTWELGSLRQSAIQPVRSDLLISVLYGWLPF